jgi:hypothetical protein
MGSLLSHGKRWSFSHGMGKDKSSLPAQREAAPFQGAETMLIRGLFASLATMFALVLLASGDVGAVQDKDKKEKELTVKQIMAKAHAKDGLRGKVIAGNASNDEKKELIDLYTALAALKSPKGDEKDWKTRTAAAVELAKAGTPADLKKIDCAGCHKAHKGK